MKKNDKKILYDRDEQYCVVCLHNKLKYKLSTTILNNFGADYYICSLCGSLQISRVYWLEEAYNPDSIDIDTGAVQRAIAFSLFIRALRASGLIKKRAKMLDFGAGSGLLVRLLRDQEFNAFGHDKYSSMVHCKEFSISSLEIKKNLNADLIVSLETFEHLLYPLKTLKKLKKHLSPEGIILISTDLYREKIHNKTWPYLSLENGQHINFFSKKGLTFMAEQCNLKIYFFPFKCYLLCQKNTSIPFLRKNFISFISLIYFFTARQIGMCNFKYCMEDNQILINKCNEKL